MNICLLNSAPFPPTEGIGNYVYNMSKRFIQKGEKVTIITRGDFGRTQEYVYEGIRILKPPFIKLYPFHVHFHGMFVNNIFKYLESDFDLVNIHSPLSPVINTKLPIISTFHTPMKTDISNYEATGLLSYESRAQAKVSCMIEKELLKRSELITAVSKSVCNELVKDYAIDNTRIRTVYNGVDCNIFCPTNKDNRDEYILFVGRLSYRKGLFDLIDCARYVKKSIPNIRFVIVGKGDLLNKIKSKINNLGLHKNFIIKGFVNKEELVRIYQNANIFVLPSHYEGLPTVLLEAMSCGLPVIATSVSGNLDVIKSGYNGILVKPKCPNEMAEAILSLLNNGEIKKKLGENARKTIEEKYTWDLIADRFLNIYKFLIK